MDSVVVAFVESPERFVAYLCLYARQLCCCRLSWLLLRRMEKLTVIRFEINSMAFGTGIDRTTLKMFGWMSVLVVWPKCWEKLMEFCVSFKLRKYRMRSCQQFQVMDLCQCLGRINFVYWFFSLAFFVNFPVQACSGTLCLNGILL